MSHDPINKISVIGLGYIGLPTAAVLASRRIKVVGVDVNKAVVETINRGEIHIVEPDLDIVVRSVVTEGYLRATTEPESADVFIIAVPTPFHEGSREPDVSYVEAAARSIAPVLEKGNLVILESTSPVGTTEKLSELLAALRPDLVFPHDNESKCDIHVAFCPERVLPGQVIRELTSNDRIVAGMTSKCSKRAVSLYKLFVTGECLLAEPRTAELAKLVENSYRDVNIAFANELSIVCDHLGVDVWELIACANRHPRVNILQPGPGVGGHCIAVDPWFIVSSAPRLATLIRTAREVNDSKPKWVLEKVRAMIGKVLMESEKTAAEVSVACYGISFKPDIDDIRQSPALEIAKQLQAEHPGLLLVIEPNLEELPQSLSGATKADLNDGLSRADVHVFLVAHKDFRGIDVPKNSVNAVSLNL